MRGRWEKGSRSGDEKDTKQFIAQQHLRNDIYLKGRLEAYTTAKDRSFDGNTYCFLLLEFFFPTHHFRCLCRFFFISLTQKLKAV